MHSLVFALLLAATQPAPAPLESSQAVCSGNQVETIVQGVYEAEGTRLTIGETNITVRSESIPAWTCRQNGVLVLVAQISGDSQTKEFANSAIEASEDAITFFGEIVDSQIVNGEDDRVRAPLSVEGVNSLREQGAFQTIEKVKL